MTDPLKPFRDAFELISPGRIAPKATAESVALELSYLRSITRADLLPMFDRRYGELYRAAKALQIAETEGPDAALLWKLAN